MRSNDGRHLRGAVEEDRARSRASVESARGALEDGKAACGRAIVALERVAVVGGGLAGLSAALRLKEAGARVELFERSRLLGGRATSFEIDGVEVDNGQHVFLACCERVHRLRTERRDGARAALARSLRCAHSLARRPKRTAPGRRLARAVSSAGVVCRRTRF